MEKMDERDKIETPDNLSLSRAAYRSNYRHEDIFSLIQQKKRLA
jgi:hypothetical protein